MYRIWKHVHAQENSRIRIRLLCSRRAHCGTGPLPQQPHHQPEEARHSLWWPSCFYHHTNPQVRHFSLQHHQLGPHDEFPGSGLCQNPPEGFEPGPTTPQVQFPWTDCGGLHGANLWCRLQSIEKAESAARAAWISDPVRPSGHTLQRWSSTCLRLRLRLARLQPPLR